MDKISRKTITMGLVSICLWLIGSMLLFEENNGKIIITVTAVAVIARISSQINRDRRASSEL
ncbi:hypothetical protein GCM10028895_30900 [Pontibacter rugosus]